MEQGAWSGALAVLVGGLTRTELLSQLGTSGVNLNASAVKLLDDPVFDSTTAETVQIVECAVASLGLTHGASLTGVLAAAERRGLSLCPPVTGPYLRLVTLSQETAPDSIMSNGRAPAGSVTIASAPLTQDDDSYPKGFYVRVIDGVPWLRGYRCTDDHTWSPKDRFAFRCEPSGPPWPVGAR